MVTKGDRPINITWHLNGKPMNNIPGVTITKIGHKSSSLSIDAVSFIHTGVYNCLVSNQAGHANFSTDLVVNGKFENNNFLLIFRKFVCICPYS